MPESMSSIQLLLTVGGIAVGIINLWFLFVIKSVREDMISLRGVDTQLGEKLAAISLLVAGQYVTRSEFQQTIKDQTATILTRTEEIAKRYAPLKGSD